MILARSQAPAPSCPLMTPDPANPPALPRRRKTPSLAWLLGLAPTLGTLLRLQRDGVTWKDDAA